MECAIEDKNLRVVFEKRVVLTKDSLGKSNWQGNKRCEFCAHKETIHHLFFEYARFIWRVVHFTFGLEIPYSVDHMFGDWLLGVSRKTKELIMTGIAALCWAIFLSRNDLVFEKCFLKTYMQVLYREPIGAGSGRSCKGVKKAKLW